ncbi:MAG: hypothetical protein Ct9H90mP22_9040 [Gammaproteobacteria bacterium]|nr:MAG: hypothetical protein Ct9H90mP22_9040 [Gammaproteobacteria bacterium]
MSSYGEKSNGGQSCFPCKKPCKRLFKPNFHKHKFWVESEKKFITLTVSAKGMRIIDKNGIDTVLKDLRTKGLKI